MILSSARTFTSKHRDQPAARNNCSLIAYSDLIGDCDRTPIDLVKIWNDSCEGQVDRPPSQLQSRNTLEPCLNAKKPGESMKTSRAIAKLNRG